MSAPSTTPPAGVGVDEVLGIASEVWTAVIGEAVLPSSLPLSPMPDDAVRAWVTIEGPWRGRVQITAPPLAAEGMSRAVLRMGPDEAVDPVDVADVLGELANVVGGAVKSLVPGSSELGLPTVATTPDPVGDAHGPLALHVDLSWREMPVCFSLRNLTTEDPSSPLPPDDPHTARGETP